VQTLFCSIEVLRRKFFVQLLIAVRGAAGNCRIVIRDPEERALILVDCDATDSSQRFDGIFRARWIRTRRCR
jgi:hypothetical protein